jgi:hypothetical protein
MPTSTTWFWNHSIETLEKALGLRKQIEALKQSANDIMGGILETVGTATVNAGKKVARRGRPPKAVSVASDGVKVDGRKAPRSAATRAKMAAAARARWAKKNASAAPAAAPVVTGAKKKKRTMSPEARAKIAAAQRARWAKSKA